MKLKMGIRPSEKSAMYPSTHDITPEYLEEHLIFIGKLLEAYKSVLIVTKPHLECIEAICRSFPQYKDKITFRFTIGSADDEVLKFWEPGAPALSERIKCIKHAFRAGFRTSVSCEPMLDNYISRVIELVRPYVTETIWIGKMNMLIPRLVMNGHDDPITMAQAARLLEYQSDENIRTLYEKYKKDPIIRWKESIQKVIGLTGPK